MPIGCKIPSLPMQGQVWPSNSCSLMKNKPLQLCDSLQRKGDGAAPCAPSERAASADPATPIPHTGAVGCMGWARKKPSVRAPSIAEGSQQGPIGNRSISERGAVISPLVGDDGSFKLCTILVVFQPAVPHPHSPRVQMHSC